MSWHPEILSGKQRKVLKQVGYFCLNQGFYLAGGTALSIRLGHRRSRDFDWFTPAGIPAPLDLAETIRRAGIPFTTSQVERGTLHGTISGVRVSFFEYLYPLLEPYTIWSDYDCRLAGFADIACMKLSAVTQRASRKDFIDIYALASKIAPLDDMIKMYQKKYSIQDAGHVLYALSYFDNADRERMPAMVWKISWKSIKGDLIGRIKKLSTL